MKHGVRLAVLLCLMTSVAWLGLAQPPAPRTGAANPAPPRPAAIATVSGRSIDREEFDARSKAALEQYKARTGNSVPADLAPIVKRQVLEGLLRREMLALEAKRRSLLPTVEEAEAEVRKDPYFHPSGKFDPARFAAMKAGNPQLFQLAIDRVRDQLGAMRLNERLEREFTLGDAEARRRAEVSLSRPKLDYLALRRAEFTGATPEPREREVVAYYHSHTEEYRRPDRATLSVVFVNIPALAESLQSNAERVREWEARMKALADSALSVHRAGVTFEDVATTFGGVHRDVIATRDNFPGYWMGDARESAAIFSQKAGTVLAQPVKGRPGWLLVRVDEMRPAHVAPLREVAREVRGRLRAEARATSEDRELRALYARLGSSLKTTAYRVRWAVIDTTALATGEPGAAELDRYYRSHLADYSGFDAASGKIQSRPLSQVEADVRARWKRDRKLEAMRATTDGIERAWRAGRRDRSAEARATAVREAGPLVLGAAVDTGLAARVVSDSLAGLGGLGVGSGAYARGRVVFQAFQAVPNYTPSYEAALPELRSRRDATKREEDERGARTEFDRDPARFAAGNRLRFLRSIVPFPKAVDVPLSRNEVMSYYRRHIDKYTAAEEVHARHILIEVAPNVRSDSAARSLAADLLQRLRGGADFAQLARQYSDDTPTREKGGDLGSFGRGAMRESFERAVWALQPGERSELVRTDLGWHVIECIDRLPPFAQPIETMWSNVGADAAQEKADSLTARRADSLSKSVKTRAQFYALTARLRLEREPIEHPIGDRRVMAELKPVYDTLESLKPGQVYPGSYLVRGIGYALALVDTILPPGPATWESSRERALAAYRAGAGERALEAKRAELDSLLFQGWSLDSVAAAWGGLQRFEQTSRRQGIPGLGSGQVLDSLVIGTAERPAALAPGGESGWISFAGGYGRVRLAEKVAPTETALRDRMEIDRRNDLERRMVSYFDTLRSRYTIRILDASLRDVELPKPPIESP